MRIYGGRRRIYRGACAAMHSYRESSNCAQDGHITPLRIQTETEAEDKLLRLQLDHQATIDRLLRDHQNEIETLSRDHQAKLEIVRRAAKMTASNLDQLNGRNLFSFLLHASKDSQQLVLRSLGEDLLRQHAQSTMRCLALSCKALQKAGLFELHRAHLEQSRAAGCTAKDCRNAGYTIKDCRDTGYTIKECRDAGYSKEDCRASGYSALDFKIAGYSARHCKLAGYSAEDCREAGYHADDAYSAGYTVHQGYYVDCCGGFQDPEDGYTWREDWNTMEANIREIGDQEWSEDSDDGGYATENECPWHEEMAEEGDDDDDDEDDDEDDEDDDEEEEHAETSEGECDLSDMEDDVEEEEDAEGEHESCDGEVGTDV